MTETTQAQERPQTRSANINIRARHQQRDLIDQAAALLGKTRSDFVLETACREAQEVLLERRVFHLNDETFQAFQALLDAPPSENPGLQRLLNAKAPWDT